MLIRLWAFVFLFSMAKVDLKFSCFEYFCSYFKLYLYQWSCMQVLLWLKQWDSCVFGSEIRTTSDEVLSSLRRHTSIAQHHKLSSSRFSWKNKFTARRTGNFRDSTFADNQNGTANGSEDTLSKKTRLPSPPEHKVPTL